MKADPFLPQVSHTQKETIQLVFPLELLAEVVSAAESAGVTVGEYISQAVKEQLTN